MPSPTPAEALGLLRETVKAADVDRGGTWEEWDRADRALRDRRFSSTLASLVAELYERLGRARYIAEWLMPEYGTPELPSAAEELDMAGRILVATEDALVAWAEGVARGDKEEPQRGG